MNRDYDVAIVGGGIVGLAHAWMAAERGLRVVLLERSGAARGASVRNFGMIWPIGQPAGELYSLALRSRELWLTLGSLGVVEVEQCGSVHLAHRRDELAVLEEFCGQSSHRAHVLNRDETLERAPLANPDGLLGGMFSPTELRVDPRTTCSRIAAWLAEQRHVNCHFQTPVTRIEGDVLHAADGRHWTADRIVVCSNSDLRTLFPEVLQSSGLQLCKLQMLRTAAQPARQSPHLAGGLTLRHYAAFAGCRSLNVLRTRITEQTPELDRFGIHVMASQFSDGEIIVGDSHEYGDDATPFDKGEIDELILRELRRIMRLRDWTIRERWHGVYAKHPLQPAFECEPAERVHVFVGTGGAGMTMSFGLAERAWRKWLGEAP